MVMFIKFHLSPTCESLSVYHPPNEVDPHYIDDLIDSLKLSTDISQISTDSIEPNTPSTKGVELTLPNVGKRQIYYPSIMTHQLRKEAGTIVDYVLSNFNKRVNASLPDRHNFTQVTISLFTKQSSPTGNVYYVRFFAKDNCSSVTLNIQSEVVQLPDTDYLNFVQVVGGDPGNVFGLSGVD